MGPPPLRGGVAWGSVTTTMVSHGFLHGGGAWGLLPSHPPPWTHWSKPPCLPSYSLVPTALLIRLGAVREGHRTCPLAILGTYPTGMHWCGPQAGDSLHGFPSGEGNIGLPASHTPWTPHPSISSALLLKPAVLPSMQVLERWGMGMGNPGKAHHSGTSVSSHMPTSQGMGKQKHAFSMCSTF